MLSGVVTYGIKSAFYKYLMHKGRGVLDDYLGRLFDVRRVIYDRRLTYDIHPYRVYVMDLFKIVGLYLRELLTADLIITPGYGAVLEPLISLFAGKLRGVPVFIKDTHWYWKHTGFSKYFWYLYFRIIRGFDGVLVPGKLSYKFWKKYGLNNVFIVHYYWLESEMGSCESIPEQYEKIRKSYDIIFLYLGRIIKKRGIDVILHAFKKTINEIGESMRPLLIIAGAGDYLGRAKELAKALGLTEKEVMFLGPVSERIKPCVYEITDVFVYVPILTDIPEEWSIPPIEAMRLGKTVIVSNVVGCLPEIYDGVIVVKWGSADELATAMTKIAKKRAKIRKDLGNKAREIAKGITPLTVYKELLTSIWVALLRRVHSDAEGLL